MATTTPDNISYPNNASTKKTVEAHIKDTADSIQAAVTDVRGDVDTLLSAKANASDVTTSLAAKASISGQAFTGNISSPAIGLGGITSPTHKLESNGRIKLRSDGSVSSGCWFTGNDGTETVFLGQLGNTSSDGFGIYHTGAWRVYTTATLTTLINDTQLQRWRGHLDRSWDNYPSITIFNTTDKGPQGEFRLHGYPGDNGGDYSIVMRSDGGFVTGSDARRKSNIEEIPDALAIVEQLSGKRFNIKNSEGLEQEDLSAEASGKKFGFLGQEAIEVIPEAVKFYPESDEPSENGYASAYSVDYASVVPLLVEAIKELSAKVTELESRLPPN